MKYLKFHALYAIPFFVFSILVDLLLLDKVYSHKLLLDWIIKTLIATALMGIIARPGKK